MALVSALVLSLSIDGAAALRHASALASLGPHPWGSPRCRAAADYVATQFRQAGLAEVQLQEFESHGIRGANVIGVLRAPGPELLVVGAHHDTAPLAPGAYDDGGGVGVLIEVARVMARQPDRARTLVFVSWDGEEAWATGRTSTAGARAYLEGLGPEARNLVAALVIEMCGWRGGSPVFHTIAYDDPLRPGKSVITPAWLIRTVQAGARFPVGDARLSWLYQPVVRAFRAPHHYGDDLAFLQAGFPAVFVSDSSFSAYYPWYHQPSDTADKIDSDSLARMGNGVLGAVGSLLKAPGGAAAEPHWFSAFGVVFGRTTLVALGALSLLPRFVFGAGGAGGKLLQAGLIGLLLWRHPVPAVWVFLLPNLLGRAQGRWVRLVAFLPLLAMLGLAGAAWSRGFVTGTRLAWWELIAAILALAVFFVPSRRGRRSR